MQEFDFQQRTRFVVGAGSILRLGELAKQLNASRVLVVSDPGVVQAGHFDRGRRSLEQAGLHVASFHDLHENPSTLDVDRGVAFAKSFQPDLLVGLGGGSSMDCAKGINFLYSCGGAIKDYWGVGKATKPMLPLIGVPTTSGTGSEAQSFALISDAETHVKMACGDPKAACRIAILDPDLTMTQPPRVTAFTGVDALTHALETFVTKKRNAISTLYAREAWRHLAHGLPRVTTDPNDPHARFQMQWGACLAGMAIEASMLGVCHALANPLTANFQIVHGQAVGAMMAHTIRWNGEHVADQYALLWHDLSGHALDTDPLLAVDQLAHWIERTIASCGLKTQLRDCGVPQDQLPALAHQATQQWTASFNPRPVSPNDALQLYQQAW